MPQDLDRVASEIAAILAEVAGAQSAEAFDRSSSVAVQPGLYSWWADATARTTLGSSLGVQLPPLIYVGQAGAGTSSATLGSRIGGNHIGGNLRGSTFRKTMAALLREPLELRLPVPKKLDPNSKERLTAWMRAHLSVALVAYPDRGTLDGVERLVLRELDPPLNLQHMQRTPARSRLSALRSELGATTTPRTNSQRVGAPKRRQEHAVHQHPAVARPDRKLHEAMQIVLEGEGWLSLAETASRVAERGLYRKVNGGIATAGQIRARATG